MGVCSYFPSFLRMNYQQTPRTRPKGGYIQTTACPWLCVPVPAMDPEKRVSVLVSPNSKSDSDIWSPTAAISELEDSSDVIDAAKERRLVRRIDIRLVPASMFIYLLSFIDKSNIGNAKILNSDTGDSLLQSLRISDQQYLVALMIFVVANTIFETPSNYLLKRLTPSRW
ncbi:hypothetical protein NM688_g6523 [Phlebia brevispora]|uniref:Uncharacterized protein n=1 Tax=Phlebia brevispora TaxID=194682 RepID=A0ACC1SF18_9APHY|nr:hypothetical protein NM688_g6523 [Phlebia brevispora]